MKYLLIFVLTFSGCLAHSGGLFGPEWTFTDSELLEDMSPNRMERKQRRKLNSLLLAIQELCKNVCEVENSKVRLKSNPEIYFDIVFDNNVLEVRATPLTSETFQKHQYFFQKFLFKPAFKIGLKPHWRIGGGHIHLDVETHFRNNPLLIRNFIVDLVNHPELFLGVFGFDLLNAPPLQVLDPKFTEGFQRILNAFDSKDINIDQFIKATNEIVYRENPVLSEMFPETKKSAKFQLINLLNWPKTIEIRGFGAQSK